MYALRCMCLFLSMCFYLCPVSTIQLKFRIVTMKYRHSPNLRLVFLRNVAFEMRPWHGSSLNDFLPEVDYCWLVVRAIAYQSGVIQKLNLLYSSYPKRT